MSFPSAAIEVEGLVKTYGPLRAVDGLSFQVRRGELLALLGPNGAGKTTTVEILEGYRRPDGGVVRVLGLDPLGEGRRLKPRIGLMLQQGGVYPQAYPLEMLELFASFYADPLDPVELLERVGLTEAARTRFRRLSGGQQQRLLLALALVGRPELVFLDEPTAAMDPQARRATWQLIGTLREQGVTILLTTHSMDEAERLADRVAIIDHGRLLALDPPRSLIDQASGEATVRFSSRAGLNPVALAGALEVTEVREETAGEYVASTTPGPEQIARLALHLRDEGALLAELRLGSRTLEDVFLALTGRELRD